MAINSLNIMIIVLEKPIQQLYCHRKVFPFMSDKDTLTEKGHVTLLDIYTYLMTL